MGHYAKVMGNIVVDVIVAKQDFIDSLEQDDAVQWVKTSYNTRGSVHYEPDSNTPSADQSKALRANFASIGDTYDPERDVFIPKMPFLTWKLDEETFTWYPPQPRPDDISDPDGNMIAFWVWMDEEYRETGDGWCLRELGVPYETPEPKVEIFKRALGIDVTE
jgi:hypothetical protein